VKLNKNERLDIDIRFLLANERTLLAWIRTSIAIEAGGVALVEIHKHHSYLGIIILLLGAGVAISGYHRYYTARRAIYNHTLPPEGIGPAVQVIVVVVIAVVLSIAQLTFLR
jgi:putative membrane protein